MVGEVITTQIKTNQSLALLKASNNLLQTDSTDVVVGDVEVS